MVGLNFFLVNSIFLTLADCQDCVGKQCKKQSGGLGLLQRRAVETKKQDDDCVNYCENERITNCAKPSDFDYPYNARKQDITNNCVDKSKVFLSHQQGSSSERYLRVVKGELKMTTAYQKATMWTLEKKDGQITLSIGAKTKKYLISKNGQKPTLGTGVKYAKWKIQNAGENITSRLVYISRDDLQLKDWHWKNNVIMGSGWGSWTKWRLNIEQRSHISEIPACEACPETFRGLCPEFHNHRLNNHNSTCHFSQAQCAAWCEQTPGCQSFVMNGGVCGLRDDACVPTETNNEWSTYLMGTCLGAAEDTD